MTTTTPTTEVLNVSRLTEARQRATSWLANKLLRKSVAIEGLVADPSVGPPVEALEVLPGIPSDKELTPSRTDPHVFLQEQHRREQRRAAVDQQTENPYLKSASQDIATVKPLEGGGTPLGDAARFAVDPLNAPVAGVPTEISPIYDQLEREKVAQNRQQIHLVQK